MFAPVYQLRYKLIAINKHKPVP